MSRSNYGNLLLRAGAVAVLTLVLCLPPGLSGSNLIANADFTNPLDQGWTLNSTQDEPQAVVQDGAATISQSFRGYTVLSQLIPVQTLDLDLSFSAMFLASVNKPDFSALSEVVVGYYGPDTSLLGQTRFYRSVNRGDLTSSSDQHLIAIKTDSSWADYGLNLKKEVAANLSAVKPGAVALVKISLSTDNGKDEGC